MIDKKIDLDNPDEYEKYVIDCFREVGIEIELRDFDPYEKNFSCVIPANVNQM